MNRLAIYCGSATPADLSYIDLAKEVGTALAKAGIGVVYGGGRLGLMGAVADAALAAGGEDTAFLGAKLVTARYFADRIMPEAGALRRKIEGGSEAMMALAPDQFAAA